jgi:hypothetical protein
MSLCGMKRISPMTTKPSKSPTKVEYLSCFRAMDISFYREAKTIDLIPYTFGQFFIINYSPLRIVPPGTSLSIS